jgi:phosphate transport system protein
MMLEGIALPRIQFHQSLAELKDKLLAMAALSQQALDAALDGYHKADASLCHYVYENEPAINSAERELDEMAYDLLAMQQPMAIDLRFIFAVIKINGDLERIGDQSVNIARLTEAVLDEPKVELPVDLGAMGEFSVSMIRMAVQSLLEADAALAERVLMMDDEIDDMNRRAHAALIRVMETDSRNATQALNALIIARNLERIGDHATNIAEDVIFWVRGADVRHNIALFADREANGSAAGQASRM